MKRVGWALAIALVIGGCGSGSTKTVTVTDSTASSSTTTDATDTKTPETQSASTTSSQATVTTATSTVSLATFKSPSGNIGCMIISGTARCDIRQRNWSPPPRPSSCPKIVDYGQGAIVTGSGAGHLVCAGDTSADPSAKVLSYNTDTVAGGFRCASRESGMTCTNTTTGHGFFISIESYRLF